MMSVDSALVRATQSPVRTDRALLFSAARLVRRRGPRGCMMLRASPSRAPPQGPQWVYEIKHGRSKTNGWAIRFGAKAWALLLVRTIART